MKIQSVRVFRVPDRLWRQVTGSQDLLCYLQRTQGAEERPGKPMTCPGLHNNTVTPPTSLPQNRESYSL